MLHILTLLLLVLLSQDPEAAGEQLMSMLMAVAHGGMDGSVGSSSGSAAVDHGLLQALNAQYQLVSAIGNAMQQVCSGVIGMQQVSNSDWHATGIEWYLACKRLLGGGA